MAIQINKGIPIPLKRTRNTLHFDEIRKVVSIMDIGDSFLIPRELLRKTNKENGRIKYDTQGIRQQLWMIFKRLNKKCAIRTLNVENHVFRCWRVE